MPTAAREARPDPGPDSSTPAPKKVLGLTLAPIPPTPRSDPSYQNRFAFVQFADQNQANMGLSMDGMTFMDRQLKVSLARTPLTNPTLAI